MHCKQTYAKKLSAVTIFAFMIILTALIPYTVYAAENSDIISVSKNSYELGAGETLYLYGETKKEFDDDVLTYATSNSSVADVNEDGNVTAVSNGEAEITITSSYGANTSCTVIVKNEAESISLNYESATIGVGETTLDLNSTVTGGASNTRIWTSSNEAVATVSSSGKVTGKSKGTAEITVTTFNGKTAVCTVTVKKAPTAKTVSLKESKKVEAGETYQIKLKYNNCASMSVKYSSSKKSVATVDKNGKITAKKKGTATITATLYNNVKKTIKITVTYSCFELNESAYEISLTSDNVEYVKFGTSSQGRPLEAYVITGNKKVTKTIVMDFAMHGFEDSYYRDGKVLVKEANKLIEYYSTHINKLKNTRLVIIPALNPDGVVAGTNNKRACSTAFGRCTAKHVDMNRDFKKFKAVESKYYAKLLKKYNPDVYLNFHGWLNETIGTSAICDIASSTLHLSGKQRNIYAYSSGYAIGYVHNKYGCPSALIEYASPSKVSHTNTCKFINKIISYYNVSA